MALFVPPVARATDANNHVLSGATWYFYQTGTLIPATVYSDAALANPLANPVTSDSGGLFASIYLDPSIEYRAILKDSAGSAIDDIDPVNPADASFIGGISAEAKGAVGDGTADDTAALQSALNTGKPVLLKSGKTYLISSGLDHVTGSGLVCLDGWATVKAKTGAGGFNNTLVAIPRTALDRNMFRANGTDDVTIRNVHFTTDGATEVVLHGIRIIGGTATVGYEIRTSFSGFFAGVMVALGSAGAGRKRIIEVVSASDSGITRGTTYFTDAIPQTTVVEIDNDLVSSTPSAPGNVRIGLVKNVLFSGTALTDFGQQTDGFNIVGHGANSTYRWNVEIGVVDGCGEPVDIQTSWGNTVRVGTIKNAYNFGVKLIHGAAENDLEVGTIEASGTGAVYIGGLNTSNTTGNKVKVGTIRNPASYGLGLTAASGDAAAILFQSGTYFPTQNVVEVGNVVGDGVNLDYIVKDGSAANGNDNLVLVGKGSGYVLGTVSAPPTNVRVRCQQRSFTELTMSANQTVASATATKVAFDTVSVDTEGLAVTASNKVTVKWPGAYLVTAQVRGDSWAVGANDQWIAELRQNAAAVRMSRGKIYFSAKDQTFSVSGIVLVTELQVGTASADISAYVTQDTGASKTVSNATGMTFLTVERVG